MPIERLESRLGHEDDEFVRAVCEAVAVVPHVTFERISIARDGLEEAFRVRVTLPAAARGYRKAFHALSPFDLRRNLEHYLRKKYGASA